MKAAPKKIETVLSENDKAKKRIIEVINKEIHNLTLKDLLDLSVMILNGIQKTFNNQKANE